MKEKFDHKSTYCRKLGHHLDFHYCRKEKKGLPCHKVMDCWFEKFDIRRYLNEYFAPDELIYIFQPPQAKVATLVELIRRAKQPDT